MKTQEELNTIKEEYVTLSKKLAELTEVELKLIFGGMTEQELIEIATKQQTDLSGKQKQDLINEMEQNQQLES